MQAFIVFLKSWLQWLTEAACSLRSFSFVKKQKQNWVDDKATVRWSTDTKKCQIKAASQEKH